MNEFTLWIFNIVLNMVLWLGMGFVVLLVIAFFSAMSRYPDLPDRSKGKYNDNDKYQ